MPSLNWADRSIFSSQEMRRALSSFQASLEAARKTAEVFDIRVAPHFEDLRKKIEEARIPEEELKRIVAEVPHGFQEIEQQGWFPDLGMTPGMMRRLATLEPSAVNKAIGEWYKGRLTEIEAELIGDYPNRSRLISNAFWAHREEKYSLSIVSLLTQVDGVWHDSLSMNLFKKGKREKTLRRFSVKDQRSVRALFLSPLGNPLEIWSRKHPKGLSDSELNRHSVLHGIDTDYDTEENSLKAISILWWSHQLTSLLIRVSN